MADLDLVRVELHRIAIPFRSAFRHAAHTRTESDAVVIALHDGKGEVGYGEVLPRAYVTGETIERVLSETGPSWAHRLLGAKLGGKDEVLRWLEGALEGAGRDLAAFSGVEIALLDLAGKTWGFSLGGLLGGSFGAELPAGVVIGFETETKALSKYCAVLRLSGKRHIKVKVGLEDDLDRLAMVSDVFKGTPLRLDANGAYAGAAEAVRALEAIKARGIAIESVEQPLTAGDLEGAKRIRTATRLRVMADESVVTDGDAQRLIEAEAADIFNVRLGKCGGVLASKRIVDRAQAAGIGVHLGTLVGETGILTRAAELFGRAVPGFACLDGKGQNSFLLAEDVLDDPRSAQTADPSRPGLGVNVSRDRLEKHARGAPRIFE